MKIFFFCIALLVVGVVFGFGRTSDPDDEFEEVSDFFISIESSQAINII
jgi:hypothetical protein